FANSFFDTEAKIKIAKALDDFGVDYIELTSPAASEQSRKDCEDMDDARIAVETGVDGVDVVIGTSQMLREHSHGKDMTYIKNTAIEVIEFVKSKGIEIRFSSEDSFRSDLVDLLSLYSADVKNKYKLEKLKEIEDLVAELVEVNIPFNNYITGFCAFTHKAGIHAKAILN
ncbi:hypothetical protein LTR04_003022, partial [Oleoguttula sp. CCFEE 6159]